MVTTVAEQKEMFTPRQIHNAKLAQDLYRQIGRPSETDYQRILRNNLIRNCPVTPTDAACTLVIYSADVAFLKGNTTQKHAAPHVPAFEAVPLPPPVMEHHLNVTLCADFFMYSRSLSYTPYPGM